MALINIFRATRRVLTEMAIGLALVAVALVPPYLFSLWFQSMDEKLPLRLAMVFSVLVTMLAGLVLLLIYVAGKAFCDWLEEGRKNV